HHPVSKLRPRRALHARAARARARRRPARGRAQRRRARREPNAVAHDGRRGMKRGSLIAPSVRSFVPLVAVLLLGSFMNANGAFFAWSTQRAVLREVAVGGIL